MPIITVYHYKEMLGVHQILNALSNARLNGVWMKFMPSKFSKHEIYIQYCFWENVENDLKRIIGEDDSIINVLRENGKSRILRFLAILTHSPRILWTFSFSVFISFHGSLS